MTAGLSRRMTYMLMAGAAAGTAALLVFIYLSPAVSWDPSIRDIDRDGVSDRDDAYPEDPSRWGTASATIVVTIVNNYGQDIWYFLVSHNGVQYQGGYFNQMYNGGSDVQTIECSWDVGTEPPEQGTVILRVYVDYTLVASITEHYDPVPDARIPVSIWIPGAK